MIGFRYLENVVTLRLNEERCIGCRRCQEVCPHQVFLVSGGRARIVDWDACLECGACAMNCPVAAIGVEAGVGCAIGLMDEWRQARRWRRGEGSCCG